jgi:ABC-type antimicrobial peptide transport system permease subunit
VVAFQVSRRTREIGIRMAIGASKGEVIKMVLRHAAILGLSGVAIGLVLSMAADQAISRLEIPHFDPLLFVLVVVSLLVVTLAAALLPARRASLIDPMIAIRQD